MKKEYLLPVPQGDATTEQQAWQREKAPVETLKSLSFLCFKLGLVFSVQIKNNNLFNLLSILLKCFQTRFEMSDPSKSEAEFRTVVTPHKNEIGLM